MERWVALLISGPRTSAEGAEVSKYLDAVPEDQKAPYAAALAVHYLARRQEELLTPLAVTLNEAAGTEGVHPWSLILPSSARVSLLTPQTVIGVRYQELVKYQEGEHRFGRFLTELSAKRGGFLPILWDAPKSDREKLFFNLGKLFFNLKAFFQPWKSFFQPCRSFFQPWKAFFSTLPNFFFTLPGSFQP